VSHNKESASEKRRHFRVELKARVSIGPFDTPLDEDPVFALRTRHADVVESMLRVRPEAQPILADTIDHCVSYLGALLDVVGELAERQQVAERSVSLSEGGIGFFGTPPCTMGEEVPLIIRCSEDPSQRPIQVGGRLVRLERQEDGEYLGFTFVEPPREVRRQLVELVFRIQRRQLRQKGTP
jgi:hypothetical protein